MNEDLKKALECLIDETISEIEELKKSRFSASEIKLDGPGEDGLKGHPANGELDKEEKEDDDDEDEDMDKGEDKDKDEDKDEDKDDKKPEMKKEEAEKSEGKNREADPNGGKHKMDKAEEAKKADATGYGKGMMGKSAEEVDTLVKSLFEERFSPLERKLTSILDLVNKIADQPLPPKGVTAKMVPLTKSTDEGTEPLNKGQVSSKLFELKKSGTQVDSLDVTKAELGQDLQAIAKKYNLA